MHWFVKFLVAAACLGGLSTGALAGKGEKSKKDKEKDKSEKKEGKSRKGAEKETGLSIPLPIGHDAEGLRVPSFSIDGKLLMYFYIESARRTDEDHLSMTRASVETYDGMGTPELMIDLPASVLDLKTRVVTSDSPVKITRSDFELTGDTMIFNTETRRGKLIGNVRMLIFDREEIAGDSDPAEAVPTPEAPTP